MPDNFSPPERQKLMRCAGDLIGPEALAKALGIGSRTIYALMSGKRAVKDGILTDTRKILIAHRQQVGALVALIRNAEANPDTTPDAAGGDDGDKG